MLGIDCIGSCKSKYILYDLDYDDPGVIIYDWKTFSDNVWNTFSDNVWKTFSDNVWKTFSDNVWKTFSDNVWKTFSDNVLEHLPILVNTFVDFVIESISQVDFFSLFNRSLK